MKRSQEKTMNTSLVRITDHTWYLPPHPDPEAIQPSIGVIAGRTRSILVDAGNGPIHAERVKREISRLGLPPIGSLIYTHHHWDHVWGACAFDAPVIAHERCSDLVAEEMHKPWSAEYVSSLAITDPRLEKTCAARLRAVRDWARFRIVVPEVVFGRTHSLDVDGITVELEYVGGDHAEDSIVVRLPQERVIFLGDCYYPPPFHLRTGSVSISTAMLDRLVDERTDYYVDGHTGLMRREELRP